MKLDPPTIQKGQIFNEVEEWEYSVEMPMCGCGFSISVHKAEGKRTLQNFLARQDYGCSGYKFSGQYIDTPYVFSNKTIKDFYPRAH